jgi:sugar-specific transcriptional regulator TrmB
MALLDNLIETGLTRHEAQLYLLLNAEGVMTGYEAAKQTGISRSNIYTALAGLVSKAGRVQIDGEVTRYSAIPASEFCANKRRHYEMILREIQEEMRPDVK